MSLGTILVVEDDHAIRRALADALSYSGYTVHDAPDGQAGLELAISMDTDLILLDIMMPKMDGLEVLSALRKIKPSQPVIFLTARGEEYDRVQGLKLGADDYVVKPFSVDELLARVEAVLRRSPARPTTRDQVRIANRSIDFERREVTLENGICRSFTEREIEVLGYLVSNNDRAVSRDELLQSIWGLDPRGTHTRTVDMTIARIRETLDDDPSNPCVVMTVRGKGYMIAPSETLSADPTQGDHAH